MNNGLWLAQATASLVRRLRRQLDDTLADEVRDVAREVRQLVASKRLPAGVSREGVPWETAQAGSSGAAEPSWQRSGEQLAESDLGQERWAADQSLRVYATMLAANAFNPIPLVDIGIDLGIFAALVRVLAADYQLSEHQYTALQRRMEDHAQPNHTLQRGTECWLTFFAERALAAILPSMGLDFLARETSKWVPGAGSTVAATIGYRMVYRFGEQIIRECEALRKEGLASPEEKAAA